MSMSYEQAQSHNDKILTKIADLEQSMVARFQVRIVQRSGTRREIVEEITTDYIPVSDEHKLYKDYRAMWPEEKTYWIQIDQAEDVRRTIKLNLPKRSDADRDPGLPDPPGGGDDPFEEI